jgi:hypothetical protein
MSTNRQRAKIKGIVIFVDNKIHFRLFYCGKTKQKSTIFSTFKEHLREFHFLFFYRLKLRRRIFKGLRALFNFENLLLD